MAEQELKNLKEAIIDLYLAIKIRSTEEVINIFILVISINLFNLYSYSWIKLMRDNCQKKKKCRDPTTHNNLRINNNQISNYRK